MLLHACIHHRLSGQVARYTRYTRFVSGLFLASAAAGRGGDLAGAHQVTNVFLQEFVVAIELVVLLLDGLDTVENEEERVLEHLGMLSDLVACLAAQFLQILARSAWAHGPDVSWIYSGVDGAKGVFRVPWDNNGSAALSVRQLGSARDRLVHGKFLLAIGGGRGGVRSVYCGRALQLYGFLVVVLLLHVGLPGVLFHCVDA